MLNLLEIARGRTLRIFVCLGMLLLWPAMVGRSQDTLLSGELLEAVPFKTLGGPVHWTDYIVDGEWRIQKHATVGHYRLLNPRERRLAAGSLQECYRELAARRRSGEVQPLQSHVVIVLHGLAGTRGFMEGLAQELREQGGYSVVNVGYASTKGTIQELTVALESVVRNMRGAREISFVGHSMGNILIRHLLYRFEVCGSPPDIRFRRWVMISPPNHGANLADTLGQSRLVQLALGPAVDQFAPGQGWPQLEQQLAVPAFEFGIIAGGKGNDTGYLPKVPGDDDGVISLSTHMLDGARDFKQVGGLHQWMPRYPSTKAATLKFLQYGHF